MKKRILTGLRPTGKLHIGHYLGMLGNTVKLQKEYDLFLMIANVQALTDNFENPEKVKESILELLMDFYAVDIDFENSTIFIQSEVSAIHEIFIYLANFSTIQQLSHHPTLKTEIAEKKFESSTPLGFYIYPLHQAADILCVNADLVPVGKDQAPMIEDCRELARKFNNTYKKTVLSQPEALFGVTKNVPGIDGNEKMGKSLGNAIYLSDDEATLRKKVFAIKTDPNRIHATDPGTVEGNTVFIYHDLFNTDLAEVDDLKKRYQLGTVSDVEVKERLYEAINKALTPIREKRAEAETKKEYLLQKAIEGSIKVQKIARFNADNMKKAMHIDFNSVYEKASQQVSFQEFAKNKMQIGKIIEVTKVESADKLLKLMVDIGREQPIQIISGIAEYFSDISSLVNKQIPILTNIEPRQLKGLESQGMILAADNENGIVLLTPESVVPNGAEIH